MNRPHVKNALGRNMLRQFNAALELLRYRTESRVVLLQSAVDRVFCAGADLAVCSSAFHENDVHTGAENNE